MFIKNKNGILVSSLLMKDGNIRHGFTTKTYGDMREIGNRNRFENKFGSLILLRQIHSNRIVEFDYNNQIYGMSADAIIANKPLANSVNNNLLFCILTADCVPLILYDPKTSVIGIVHAGWKGTLHNISKNAVHSMVKLGSNPDNILVAIGPYIQLHCYSVGYDRAKLFREEFGNDTAVVLNSAGKSYVDLGKANAHQLEDIGIKHKNIDITTQCTSCLEDDFYSYRRNHEKDFGEMLSFIGFGTV